MQRPSLQSAAREMVFVKLRVTDYAARNDHVKRLMKEIIHDLGFGAPLARVVFG